MHETYPGIYTNVNFSVEHFTIEIALLLLAFRGDFN